MSKEGIIEELIKFNKDVYKYFDDRDDDGSMQDPNIKPLEFVFGVILDQGIKYERAWNAPYILKKRMGHLDINKIAKMNPKDLEKYMFDIKPALHRYRFMADRLIRACELISERYDGDARKIWNCKNLSAKDIENRFSEFAQIGQKKASMAVNILVRDWDIKIAGPKKFIDISYDIHVRRVFLRTGLIQKDKESILIDAAIKLNPDYPGELDMPSWTIGKNWCRPKKPDCIKCPIKNVCPKKTNVAVPKGNE